MMLCLDLSVGKTLTLCLGMSAFENKKNVGCVHTSV